jgi:chemotaxis protein methyltransferase CheR
MMNLAKSAIAEDDLELELLLEAIYRRFHHDFRGYSRASLRRRLRQALRDLGVRNLSALQEGLLHDAQVFPSLIRFLTVQVSDLFRDPEFFFTFRRDVVPVLRTYPLVRLWVAGCSTGEEAYSFAILLKEEGLLEKSMIYATDINTDALRRAEAGIYPSDRLETFTRNHRLSGAREELSAHYTAAYGSALFDRSLRQKILFSDHSLATDCGFAEMQVISCRNVLIYFERSLQTRALGLFRDSLCRRGFLGLGAQESLRFTAHEPSFSEVSQRWYQRC